MLTCIDQRCKVHLQQFTQIFTKQQISRSELSSCCFCHVFSHYFAQLQLQFLPLKRVKCPPFFLSQPKQLNLVPNFSRQFENFEIYKDLYGKLFKRDWVAKVNTVVKISQDTTHLIVQLDIRISYYLRSSENFQVTVPFIYNFRSLSNKSPTIF